MNSWALKVGDSFEKGDLLCNITLPVATIGVEARESGVLAKIIVDEYHSALADSDIALYAISRDYYNSFIDSSMQEAEANERLAAMKELEEAKKHHD